MFFGKNADGFAVVYDLEWNQSSYRSDLRMPHEIIEIGAVRVDASWRVTDSFSRLIRPRVYKKLDKHIRSVTGITEEELRDGGAFEEVFADFCRFSEGAAAFLTWGRDDYPVLRRNARYFRRDLPFGPPLDAQLVFAFACLGDAHQQMNLHGALEYLQLSPDVPAHRAVYDAQCTALLLPKLDEAVRAMDGETYARLLAACDRERRIADSTLVSVNTRHAYHTSALADRALMALPCPVCGADARFDTPWYDGGRDKYLALAECAEHGLICGQMHFKRSQSGLLVMHRRAFPASEEEAGEIREGYRRYRQTPPRKRHHQLNMEDALRKAEEGPEGVPENALKNEPKQELKREPEGSQC